MKRQKFIITNGQSIYEYLENYQCKKCGYKKARIFQDADKEEMDMFIICQNCGYKIHATEL